MNIFHPMDAQKQNQLPVSLCFQLSNVVNKHLNLSSWTISPWN